MNQENREYVLSTIRNEGFHYAFDGYSDFEEVDDLVFHRLRLNYLEAARRLEHFLKTGKDNFHKIRPQKA